MSFSDVRVHSTCVSRFYHAKNRRNQVKKIVTWTSEQESDRERLSCDGERESETVTAEDSSGVEGGLEATATWRVAWKQRRRRGWLGSNDGVKWLGGWVRELRDRFGDVGRREVAWIGGWDTDWGFRDFDFYGEGILKPPERARGRERVLVTTGASEWKLRRR